MEIFHQKIFLVIYPPPLHLEHKCFSCNHNKSISVGVTTKVVVYLYHYNYNQLNYSYDKVEG